MQTQMPVLDTSLRTTEGGISINEGFFLAFLDQEMRADAEQAKIELEKLGIDLKALEQLKEKIEQTKEEMGYSGRLETIHQLYPAESRDLLKAKSVLNKPLLDAAKIPVEAILKYATISMGASDKYFGANAAR